MSNTPTSLLIHQAGWTSVLPRTTCVQRQAFPRQRSLYRTLWHSLIAASHLFPHPNTSQQACPPFFGIFPDRSIWQGALYCPPHRCPLSCKQTRVRRGIHQEQCRGPVPSCILNCGIGISLNNITNLCQYQPQKYKFDNQWNTFCNAPMFIL